MNKFDSLEKLKSLLDKEVVVIVDRKLGSNHFKFDNTFYPINYGHIKDFVALDNEYQDAYIIGPKKPLNEFKGIVIAIVNRLDDNEDKLVVSYKNAFYTNEEIENIISFQEKYFNHVLIRNKNSITSRDDLLKTFLEEEKIAYIKGWDFSHIKGKYEEEHDLPWNYRKIVLEYLYPKAKLLDLDTGGGEFLLSLNHPYLNTYATENYPPNIELCTSKLLPLGINFKVANSKELLPFDDNIFDIVINRHGGFNAKEIYRVLKPNGVFITEQVGALNDRELVELLLGKKQPLPFPRQYLNIIKSEFEDFGFAIIKEDEAYRPIKFYDTTALVWFAKIIKWEFINFSVEKSKDNLFKAQKILNENGVIEGTIHRFLLVCRKIVKD